MCSIIASYPKLSHGLDKGDMVREPSCNKDTGSKKPLRKWTMGHLFIVRGGGHIDMWQPLYKYEIYLYVYVCLLLVM